MSRQATIKIDKAYLEMVDRVQPYFVKVLGRKATKQEAIREAVRLGFAELLKRAREVGR